MNTTDRSTGTLDYALRRRFCIQKHCLLRKNIVENQGFKYCSRSCKHYLMTYLIFIKSYKADDMNIEDLMVGHSLFFLLKVKKELKMKNKLWSDPL
jgi:5-methylcytosine-specific restriction protein B